MSRELLLCLVHQTDREHVLCEGGKLTHSLTAAVRSDFKCWWPSCPHDYWRSVEVFKWPHKLLHFPSPVSDGLHLDAYFTESYSAGAEVTALHSLWAHSHHLMSTRDSAVDISLLQVGAGSRWLLQHKQIHKEIPANGLVKKYKWKTSQWPLLLLCALDKLNWSWEQSSLLSRAHFFALWLELFSNELHRELWSVCEVLLRGAHGTVRTI